MVTTGKVVSDIINSINAVSKDTRVPRRLVLSKLKDRAKTYITQRLEDGKLNRQSSLFTEVPCVKFKKVDIINCKFIQFRSCVSLMKSVKPISDVIESRYGPQIYLYNLDKTISIGRIDFQGISSELSREFGSLDTKFTIAPDGYIYILNPKDSDIELKGGHLIVLTQEVSKIKKLSECDDCECKSEWDYDFICPDLVLDNVKTTVINDILGTTLRVNKDENPNLDSNQKSQTKE